MNDQIRFLEPDQRQSASSEGARSRPPTDEKAKAGAGEQVAQQSQQTRQATAEQIENFEKAFSVCLEGKKYLVKF